MSTDKITNHELPTPADSSEGLRSQAYNPSDKLMTPAGDHMTDRELLERNEMLIAQVQATADRIAIATVNHVNTLPEQWQAAFYQGISNYAGKEDEPVYAAVFRARDLTEMKSA